MILLFFIVCFFTETSSTSNSSFSLQRCSVKVKHKVRLRCKLLDWEICNHTTSLSWIYQNFAAVWSLVAKGVLINVLCSVLCWSLSSFWTVTWPQTDRCWKMPWLSRVFVSFIFLSILSLIFFPPSSSFSILAIHTGVQGFLHRVKYPLATPLDLFHLLHCQLSFSFIPEVHKTQAQHFKSWVWWICIKLENNVTSFTKQNMWLYFG